MQSTLMKTKKDVVFGNRDRYIPKDQLADPLARMLRNMLEKMGINQARFKTYLDDFIRQEHPDDSGPIAEVKKARSSTFGNIMSTLFYSKSLSFSKICTAFKIIRFTEFEFIIRAKTEQGEIVEVSEKVCVTKVRNSDNS